MKWESQAPTECDLCHRKLKGFAQQFFVDGKTVHGPWAIMCPDCHKSLGCGLGIGKGQKYNLNSLEKLEG